MPAPAPPPPPNQAQLAAKAIADFQATEKALAAQAAGPLPGGYAVGEKVFCTGAGETFPDGDKVTHGQPGEVKGPTPGDSKLVAVMFPRNKRNVNCFLTKLSRTPPPPLPGGYAVGDRVFYTGASQLFPSGDKVTRGQAGEVKGHPDSDGPWFGEGVAVMFPGNKRNDTNCDLTDLSRTPP